MPPPPSEDAVILIAEWAAETERNADMREEERGRWVFLEHIVGLKMPSIFNFKVFFSKVFSSSEVLQSDLITVPPASIRCPEPLQLESRWSSYSAH